MSFGGTVDGTNAKGERLDLTAGGGDIEFIGAVGFAVELGKVTVASARDVTAAAGLHVARFEQVTGSGTTDFGAVGIVTKGNDGTILVTTSTSIKGTITNFTAEAPGTVILTVVGGTISVTVDIGNASLRTPDDFGVLQVSATSTTLSGSIFSATELVGRTAVKVLKGGCTFNGFPCTNDARLFASLVTETFRHDIAFAPVKVKIETTAIDKSPAQAAFCNTCAVQIGVFDADYFMVEAAPGTETSYRGMDYLFQGVWKLLEGAVAAR